MSNRAAVSSSRTHGSCAVEDVLAAYPVRALVHGLTLDQIHPATEDGFEFVLHPEVLAQSAARPGSQGDQDVEIALWPEIIAEHGAEQGQFRDVPLLAEG